MVTGHHVSGGREGVGWQCPPQIDRFCFLLHWITEFFSYSNGQTHRQEHRHTEKQRLDQVQLTI